MRPKEKSEQRPMIERGAKHLTHLSTAQDSFRYCLKTAILDISNVNNGQVLAVTNVGSDLMTINSDAAGAVAITRLGNGHPCDCHRIHSNLPHHPRRRRCHTASASLNGSDVSTVVHS
jgi:hypothetical protein